MKRVFRKLFVFVLFILYSPNLLGHGTIIIQNVEHDNGYIDLKIYTDKKSFLKEELAVESVRKKAVRKPAKKKATRRRR